VFSRLERDDFGEALLDAVSARPLQKGAILAWEGDAASHVFGLIEGSARLLLISPQGRRQVLSYVAPGNLFNLSSVFSTNRKNLATISMASRGRVLLFPAAPLIRAIRSGGSLASTILQALADENAELVALTQDLALRTVRQRLARFILRLRDGTAPTKWTHQQVAEHIGSVREVVNRGLRSLAKDGLIELRRHQVLILDEERLRNEAGCLDSSPTPEP
jgi:CRP/FNR family transcriptional regulator